MEHSPLAHAKALTGAAAVVKGVAASEI